MLVLGTRSHCTMQPLPDLVEARSSIGMPRSKRFRYRTLSSASVRGTSTANEFVMDSHSDKFMVANASAAGSLKRAAAWSAHEGPSAGWTQGASRKFLMRVSTPLPSF